MSPSITIPVPVGPRAEKNKNKVIVALDGDAVLLDGQRLTFDEAEAIAFALRDLAIFVRIKHGVGFTEVA